MQSFFQNIWVKRVISLVNLAYVAVIAVLTYATFLYELEFKPGAQFSFLLGYVIVNGVFLTLMILTKDEFITKVVGIILPPLVFVDYSTVHCCYSYILCSFKLRNFKGYFGNRLFAYLCFGTNCFLCY